MLMTSGICRHAATLCATTDWNRTLKLPSALALLLIVKWKPLESV
jgi:hypothetical protein